MIVHSTNLILMSLNFMRQLDNNILMAMNLMQQGH